MKTIAVPEICERWTETERALETEGEIIVTRDGKAVARLLPVKHKALARNTFDPDKNRKRREKLWGKGVVIDTLTPLLEDREDRQLL